MSDKEIFFINGMPRSGSTLLCNILAQNPDFHVTPTSGLSEMIHGVNHFWKTSPIIKASETPQKKIPIINGLLQSYHSDTDRPVVFNKSRTWVTLIETLENCMDKPVKILTTTRKMTQILASMEKLYRKELKNIDSPMHENPNMNTLVNRINIWMDGNGLVGGTFNAIQDAFIRGNGDKIHLVDYDKLTSDPTSTLKEVYRFLDKPYYDHDFNNVPQYTIENDAEHGFTDLHTIRPKIKPQVDDSKKILGPLHQQFEGFHFNFNF